MLTVFLERYDYKKIYSFLIYAFIFTLPLQINIIYYSPKLFLGGNFNIYLHFLLYIGDLFLLLSLFFLGIAVYLRRVKFKRINSKIFPFLTLFILVSIFSYFFAIDKNIAFFSILRILSFYYLYLLIENEIVSFDKIKKLFIFSVFFQAIIAIFQFITQSSLCFEVLGEPVIGAEVPGVAKINFGDLKIVRVYGTFPHPNIFSLFVLTAIFFVLQFIEKKTDKNLNLFFLVIFLIALLLAFSRLAILGLIGLLFFYLLYSKSIKKWVVMTIGAVLGLILLASLAFPLKSLLVERITDMESINERIELMEISSNMFLENPFGVGMKNFTLAMSDYTDQKLFPWEYQPVHNVFMLILNELGVIALILFVFMLILIFKNINKKNIGFYLAIVLFLLFDHFLFSLYQGQVLLFLFLTSGIIGNEIKESYSKE